LLANFDNLKEGGEATEKNSKLLIVGISRNINFLFIHQKIIEIFQKNIK